MLALTYNEYFDKVLGGWMGKCLGGTIGSFEGTREITHFNIFELLPEAMVPNDDLDIQLIWLDVLLDKGIHFTSSQLMEAWLCEYDYNMGEYGYSRRNYLRGIMPPVSGIYANDFYKNSMGCPIRSDVWGMICPGNTGLAAEYAHKDGCLDHEGESIWAEQFLSAMEAAAFFEKDIGKLIHAGMEYVPADSRLYRCIRDAISGFESGLLWKKTWEILRNHHSHPDCTYAPFNMGIIIMALLYGGGSFEKTLYITVNSGWDVDCTCSSAAAVLGIIHGRRGFDRKWLDYIGDRVVTMARPVNKMDSLVKITEYTCRAGVTIINDGLSSTQINNVPARLDYLPAIHYRQELDITVNYMGAPSIGYKESKQITFRVANYGDRQISGVLKLQLPSGWESNWNGMPLKLEARQKTEVQFIITIPENINVLSDTNILTITFQCSSGEEWSHVFGLCGSPVCRVLGPFFDTYKDWLDLDRLPKERILCTPSFKTVIPASVEEWCNHRIDPDKEYIDENFSNHEQVRSIFSEGIYTSIYDDRYEINGVFGLHGPGCIYCYQEVYSPEDRMVSLLLGSSDPFKVWLNGKLVFTQKGNMFWLPTNNPVAVKLKKGLNYIVLKVLRTGSNNRLSMAFRQIVEGIALEHDLAPFFTDLSYGTLSNIDSKGKQENVT